MGGQRSDRKGALGSQRFVGAAEQRTNCSVGEVQAQDGGWGFVVTTGERCPIPLFSLTYKTKAEAEEAHSLMIKVIEGAEITARA